MSDRANILVVDDEMGPRESLKVVLSPYYNVHMAERADQALEILSQLPIDLITVDLKMPGIPGIKVLEKIKQNDPDIEAIIITGYGSMETAIQGLRLGAFDYIAKPFDVNQITVLIRRALERRSAKIKMRQLKSNLLANISHELRTPMGVIMGYVSLLLDQFIGELSEEQHRILERVQKNSEELLELIENVLYLTSLYAGDASFREENFDIGVVIGKSLKKFEKFAEERGVHFSMELPPGEIRIVSDQQKVSRIFQNLLHNAVKFTPKGQITIKVSESVNGKTVDFEIQDTGIGIEPDQIENMFQPFWRLDESTRHQFGGVGLGLTVARRLTDFLHGTLEIRSRPGLGTHVLFRLPHQLECEDGSVVTRKLRIGHG
jgi:signal transduction histidine kinase